MRQRRTRQLDAIYETVRTAMDHPTAEEVHARVRRRIPSVSLGTVYRNLQKLAAQERVRVLHAADRAARYDAVLVEHDHFVCDHCGEVTDIARARGGPMDGCMLTRAGYRIRTQSLSFYGTCANCVVRMASPGHAR